MDFWRAFGCAFCLWGVGGFVWVGWARARHWLGEIPRPAGESAGLRDDLPRLVRSRRAKARLVFRHVALKRRSFTAVRAADAVERQTSAAEAAGFVGSIGTTEVVPFPVKGGL
jgi:hypothetical protein